MPREEPETNGSNAEGFVHGAAAGGAKIGIEAAVGGAGKQAAGEFLEEVAKAIAARARPIPIYPFPTGHIPPISGFLCRALSSSATELPGFPFNLPSALSSIGTQTAVEFAATSAAGAILIESAFIVGDFGGALFGSISYDEAKRRMPARLGNMALNATGSGVGSAVGTVVLPGYGYFVGGFVGSVVAGMCNWSTAKPASDAV